VLLALEAAATTQDRTRELERTPSTSGFTVAGSEIVGVRLIAAAYAHGLALALPEKVAMARPTGVGRALATWEIPIEGREEWLAAARRLA
jgi:hypothetical protein